MKLNARSIVEHLSLEQSSQLLTFAELLRDRADPLGLVSKSDVDRLWERHILDSLRGLLCLRQDDRTASDVGSGAGLPGIPLAIAAPAMRFALIEPKRRRAAFLEMAVEALGLGNVAVVPGRVEQAVGGSDVCLVRALASPTVSWGLASRLLSDGGRLLYWAGRTWGDSQVEELARNGVKAEICLKREFQWQGPLVIMTRLSQHSPRSDERA